MKATRTPATLPAGLEREARLTLDQVATLTGKRRTKIYAEIKAGTLPQPERSGKRCSRWRAGDLLDAMAATKAA